jgi:vacuolar-type H+-ATPase subunit I/STV1
MQELDELKQELESLTVEHEALGLRYAELQEAEDAAPRNWNHLAMPVGSPEFYEAQKQRMEVGEQQQRVESRMAWIGRRIQYLEQLAGADAEIAKAQEIEQAAAQRVARIGESLSRVVGQLEELQAGEVQGAERRQQAEQGAAQALAAATACGDSKALKAAQASMEAVIAEGRDARARQEANAPVITALEAEAEAQRQQLTAAQAEQKKAASAVNAALRLKKGAEWDQAVNVLAEIGADLVALGVRYPLTDLKVPTFAPGGGGDVTLYSLQRQHQQAAA